MMEFYRCPGCHVAVQGDDEQTDEGLTCPSCGTVLFTKRPKRTVCPFHPEGAVEVKPGEKPPEE